MATFVDEGCAAGLERAIRNAKHLRAKDSAAVAAARALARKIDAWDRVARWAVEDAESDGGRPKVPANDNVSPSAFLKYLDALGLLPDSPAVQPRAGGTMLVRPPEAEAPQIARPVDPLEGMRQGLRAVQ